MKKDWWIVD